MNNLDFDKEVLKGKTIVFCIPGNKFSNKFLLAWSELLVQCCNYGIKIITSNSYTSNVYYVRNMCLGGNILRGKKQLPFNGKIKYDYMMWIDSDIVFNASQIFYLITEAENRNFKVLSGLYIMENNTHYPVVENLSLDYFKKNGTFEFLSKSQAENLSDFTEVEYTGFGFLLIANGVFEKFNYPWFSPQTIAFDSGNIEIQDFCSEDVSFCFKLRKKSIPINIASRVLVKHEKTIPL